MSCTHSTRQVKLSARREGHREVARVLLAVDLDRLVDLVELGDHVLVDLTLLGTDAGKDLKSFLPVTRLEEPTWRFCVRILVRVMVLPSSLPVAVSLWRRRVPGMKKVKIARPMSGLRGCGSMSGRDFSDSLASRGTASERPRWFSVWSYTSWKAIGNRQRICVSPLPMYESPYSNCGS